MVENFGDAPFYPDDAPKHVVASVTRAATAITTETDLPLGINVLRNDAEAGPVGRRCGRRRLRPGKRPHRCPGH